MRVLNDFDRMPFGKYKEELMQDVPADYLWYLWTNGMSHKSETDAVANYIKRSLNALKIECPNKLWS